MKLGFIGTGKIASSVITGICNSKIKFNKILISPRNKIIAKNLKRKFKNIVIAKNNQEIVDNCNWVFLSITPTVGDKIIKDLNFRPSQTVISFISTITLSQLKKAIKLVYASTYLKEPKALIENSVHHHEEEKMAVIIMELVGKEHRNLFYPSASGSAQSFNYYPVSYMKRNEGVAHIALGLGRTIAEGEKALRFSPKYPGIIPQYYSIRSTIDNSQNQFYALDLKKASRLLKDAEQENTSSFELSIAEQDGELYWAGSVISNTDNVLRDSLRYEGPRVITFPSFLKWETSPVPDILIDVLKMGENALGCPIEIEFAINMYKDDKKENEFCLLQIKPMVIGGVERVHELESINKDDVFCKSSIALGNGLIDNIQNIVIVNPNTFDASQTEIIAKDIEHINKGPIDALKSSGATKSQIISFGVIPQILPSFVANNLYILDRNVRMATMLGIVGAGGIGYELQSSFRMFEYERVSAIIILIFVTIFLIDHFSAFIRSKIK